MTTSNNTQAIENAVNTYLVLEWGPSAAGDEIGKNASASQVINLAQAAHAKGHTVQVMSLAWGTGSVVTWEFGGASTKGFSERVPEDARSLVEVLDARIPEE